jgi:hypothetical protein
MNTKLELPNVEIISINTVNPEQSVKAIEYSCKEISFTSKKIFSDTVPGNLPPDIVHIQIPKFTTREAYSEFTLKEMHNYIDSEFVLMIHDDGFVINPHLWNPDFLKYDYIGAPWPGPASDIQYGRVGNGGFCIRSKRLLEATRHLEYEMWNDDWSIGVTHNKILRDMDIHTAPVTLAMTFALELPIGECEYNLENTFGFHSRRSHQHIEKINLLD